MIFLKLGILTKNDIEDALSVLPASVATPLTSLLARLGRLLNRSY
jgi:hypothetical protein